MRAVLGVIGLSVLIFANYVDESAAAVAVAGGGRGRSSDQLGDNMQCKPGSHFRHECNWCGCTKEGWMICTTLYCAPELRERRAISANPQEPQPDQDRCQLPADSGPCEAIFRVFRFNPETNRCEAFLYGGCQGNDNRFDTPEECQQTCGGSFPVIESAAVAVAGGGRARSSDQLGGNMQCKPGSRFRQKCNWCTCSRQGLKLCTKRMCRPGADFSKEPQCEGDAMFLDEENCNWCSCHNGIAACTLKICPNLAQDQDDHVGNDHQGTNQSVTSDPSGIV